MYVPTRTMSARLIAGSRERGQLGIDVARQGDEDITQSAVSGSPDNVQLVPSKIAIRRVLKAA